MTGTSTLDKVSNVMESQYYMSLGTIIRVANIMCLSTIGVANVACLLALTGLPILHVSWHFWGSMSFVKYSSLYLIRSLVTFFKKLLVCKTKQYLLVNL